MNYNYTIDMAPNSSEKKSRKPFTLNQKLEMIKLQDEGNSNTEIGHRLGLARKTASF